MNRAIAALVGAGLCAAGATAGPVLTVYGQPPLDRWMYPFGSTPGTELQASSFASLLFAGFDDRDAEFLIGFDTTSAATPGQGAASYVISSVRVHATISEGNRFVYDPSWDSVATSYDPGNPLYVTDSDPGKPIELFACGYRNGYGPTTTPTTTEFCETCPFGGAPIVPPAEGARNVFPVEFDAQGIPIDVSRQVRLQIEGHPLAVGTTTTVQPGQLVPANTEFVFDVDLCAPGARAYFQQALNSGRLNLLISSLHPTSGQGSTAFPVFYTKDNPIAVAGGYTAKLEIVVNQGLRADFDNNGSLNVLDFVAFLNAFAARSAGADADDNCTLNVLDFNAFLDQFAARR